MKVEVIKLENQGLKNETKWFMIITNNRGTQLTMNVGERTHKAIQEMNEQDEADKQPDKPGELFKQHTLTIKE